MTQPNQFNPPNSVNYSGLAAFAEKAKLDWELGWVDEMGKSVGQLANFLIGFDEIIEPSGLEAQTRDAIKNLLINFLNLPIDLAQLFIGQIPIFGPLINKAIDQFQELIDGVLGGGVAHTLDEFIGFLQQVPIIKELLDTFLGAGFHTGSLLDLGSWAQNVSVFGNILNGNIMGGGLNSLTPISNIVDSLDNVLINPFETFEAILDDFFDATTGFNGSFSGHITADGSLIEFISNPIRVIAGQAITGEVRVRWENLVGSGSPIQLKLWTDVGEFLLSSIPFSSSGEFNDNFIAGTVSALGNATMAALKLVVDSTARAGDVWFTKPLMSVAAVPDTIAKVVGLSGSWNNLYDIFNGTTGSTNKTLTNVLTSGKSLMDILGGIANATPTDIDDRLVHLVAGTGLFDAAFLTNIANIPVHAQNRVTNLVNDLADRLRVSGTNGADDFFDKLRGAFNATSAGISATATSLNTDIRDLFAEVIDLPFTLANTTARGIYNDQTTRIVANIAVTPYDSVIQNIEDWWNAETWVWWS